MILKIPEGTPPCPRVERKAGAKCEALHSSIRFGQRARRGARGHFQDYQKAWGSGNNPRTKRGITFMFFIYLKQILDHIYCKDSKNYPKIYLVLRGNISNESLSLFWKRTLEVNKHVPTSSSLVVWHVINRGLLPFLSAWTGLYSRHLHFFLLLLLIRKEIIPPLTLDPSPRSEPSPSTACPRARGQGTEQISGFITW